MSVLILCLVILFVTMPQVHYDQLVGNTLVSKTLFFNQGLLLLLPIFAPIVVFNTQFLKINILDVSFFILANYIVVNRYFIQSRYGFSLRFIELLGLIFLYFLLRFVPLKYFIFLLFAFILSGILQAIYGLGQGLGYINSYNANFSITGNFFNPGPYAGYLCVAWVMALGVYLYRKSIILMVVRDFGVYNYSRFAGMVVNYLPYIALSLISVALVAVRSRAAWLAMIVSTLLFMAFRYRPFRFLKQVSMYKRILLFILSASLVVVGMYGAYIFKKDSAEGRLLIWDVITGVVADKPFMGIGFDRFESVYMNAQAVYFTQNPASPFKNVADNTNYAFNEVLQFLVEEGVIGLCLGFWVILIGIGVYKKNREYSLIKVAGMALLAIVVFGLFAYPSQILPIKVTGVCLAAIMGNVADDMISLHLPIKRSRRWVAGTALLAAILIVITLSTKNKQLTKGYIYWKRALRTYSYGLYMESTEEFKRLDINGLFNRHGQFLMQYGKALAMAGEHQKAKGVLGRAQLYLSNTVIMTAIGDVNKNLGCYHEAQVYYQLAGNMVPNRFYPGYLEVRLYQETEQYQKARKKASELMRKKEKIHSPAIEEIKREMKKVLEIPLNDGTE